jgi:hypothetical protein
MMKNLILGITLVSLAQTAGIYSAKADDDNGLRLVTGTVNANGTSQTPTNTFTIAHPSAGRYVITFTPFVFGKRYTTSLYRDAVGLPDGSSHTRECQLLRLHHS